MSILRVFGRDTTINDNNDNNNNTDAATNKGISPESSSRSRSLIEDGTKGVKQVNANYANNTNKKVNLLVLMFPGIASSGLFVDKSGLDNEKYKGRRLWMNAVF